MRALRYSFREDAPPFIYLRFESSIFQSVSTVSSWIGGSVAQTHHPPSHLTPPSSSTGIFSNSDSAQLPSPLSLTEDVWWEFLLCTAELLYDGIVLGGCIMEGQFNEWGALLLQQEVSYI